MSDSPDVLSDVTAAAQSALPDADTAPPSVSPPIPLDPNATPAGAVLSGQPAPPSVAAGGAPANTGVGSQVDPAAAPPVTPHQSFLSKLLHAVGEAFAPSTKQTVDSQGNIVNTPLNSGQRAVGGIGRFLTAAGPALAQHGPGSFGKSIAAGEEAVNDQQQQQRQNLLNQAQNVRSTSKSAQDQLLTQASLAKASQDQARNALDMKAAGMELDKNQIALATALQDIKNVPGVTQLAHFDSNSDIGKHLDTAGPQLAKQYAVDLSKNNIRLLQNPNGGLDAFTVPKGAGEMAIGEGKFLLTPVIDPKTNQLTLKSTPADPNMPVDKHQAWNLSSSSAYNSAQKNQADIAKTKAETTESNAKAALSTAQAKNLAGGGAKNDDGSWNQSSIPVSLVEANMDPSQLSKRSTDYNAKLQAANEYSMAKYGKPFDIAQAQADYKYASAPQTQNTLKYLNSLVGADNKSGNLSTLVNLSNTITRTDFPALNNASAWTRLETGDPAIAQYHAAAVDVADQFAKIMGGNGASTDAKIQQGLDMFKQGFSKKQLAGVASTARTLLASRKDELVGGNRYLQKQYGTPAAQAAPPVGVSHDVVVNGAVVGRTTDGGKTMIPVGQ